MLLTIHNDSDYPITVDEIALFYNSSSPTGQGLTGILGDGELLWDGFKSGSPTIIADFPDNAQIEPWSSIALKFFFTKNVKINGTEYVMISFVENGCPIYGTQP
jgi:hypothetical protein